MFVQKEAILRLLNDDDPWTVQLVKEQLSKTAADNEDNLQDLIVSDHGKASHHVREILGEIDSSRASEQLHHLCKIFPDRGNIEPPNWLLARALLPGVNVDIYRKQIDSWGRSLAHYMVFASSPRQSVSMLSRFISNELGFNGNHDDYYNPNNSLLPTVIESKKGIPISLTLLYILIGHRAGMTIEAVNFPGHFLGRYKGILFDPFDSGKIISQKDCENALKKQSYPSSSEQWKHTSNRSMFRRILANLLYIFQNDDDQVRATKVANWIHALDH